VLCDQRRQTFFAAAVACRNEPAGRIDLRRSDPERRRPCASVPARHAASSRARRCRSAMTDRFAIIAAASGPGPRAHRHRGHCRSPCICISSGFPMISVARQWPSPHRVAASGADRGSGSDFDWNNIMRIGSGEADLEHIMRAHIRACSVMRLRHKAVGVDQWRHGIVRLCLSQGLRHDIALQARFSVQPPSAGLRKPPADRQIAGQNGAIRSGLGFRSGSRRPAIGMDC